MDQDHFLNPHAQRGEGYRGYRRTYLTLLILILVLFLLLLLLFLFLVLFPISSFNLLFSLWHGGGGGPTALTINGSPT